jgi:ABC-type sugar transport system permease subunit
VLALWQRLLITLGVMLLASLVAGLIWRWIFNLEIPSYLSGLIGGISALPTWELLRKVRRRQ